MSRGKQFQPRQVVNLFRQTNRLFHGYPSLVTSSATKGVSTVPSLFHELCNLEYITRGAGVAQMSTTARITPLQLQLVSTHTMKNNTVAPGERYGGCR